MKVVVEHSTL